MPHKARTACLKLLLVIVVVVMTAAPASFAQGTTNAQATATVLTALSVTVNNNLVFGNVLQGVPKEIGPDDNDSTAQFVVTGQASASVSMVLTLPSYLSHTASGDQMMLVFASDQAVVDTNATTPASVTSGDGWLAQNPYSLPAGAVIGSGGQTNVYLGGKVIPEPNQEPGTYEANIILSVSYLGS
ncbi:hypothetical protein GF356_01340 [candidate division GN15 bacterium]|nr:hypothetical protein [candidate division GN15 bacterium]